MAEQFHGTVVSADHPSLDDQIAAFAEQLRAEPRYFGPLSSANPKPSRSLIERVCRGGVGVRVAALEAGAVVGLARIDDHGEVLIAVAPHRRGAGVGTALAAALVERARAAGCTRLVLRSSRRSRAALALGRNAAFDVVEHGRGRVDLVRDLGRERDLDRLDVREADRRSSA